MKLNMFNSTPRDFIENDDVSVSNESADSSSSDSQMTASTSTTTSNDEPVSFTYTPTITNAVSTSKDMNRPKKRRYTITDSGDEEEALVNIPKGKYGRKYNETIFLLDDFAVESSEDENKESDGENEYDGCESF